MAHIYTIGSEKISVDIKPEGFQKIVNLFLEEEQIQLSELENRFNSFIGWYITDFGRIERVVDTKIF